MEILILIILAVIFIALFVCLIRSKKESYGHRGGGGSGHGYGRPWGGRGWGRRGGFIRDIVPSYYWPNYEYATSDGAYEYFYDVIGNLWKCRIPCSPSSVFEPA